MVEPRVHLHVDQVGACGGEGTLDAGEGRLGEKDHVVRRRLRLRADGCADLLEERVGCRELDDAIDAHAHRGEACPSDGDGVTRRRVEVGSGLLGKEYARSGTREGADLAREGAGVVGRQPEDDPGSRRLHRTAGARGEARGGAETHREGRSDPGKGPGGRDHAGRRGAALGLDLPVDRDAPDCPVGHLRGGRREEGSDRGEQGDADGHPEGGRDQAAPASREQPSDPGRGQHEISRKVVWSRPSCISQRSGRRSATVGSWVVTTRAAPLWSAAARSTSMTADPFARSS